ncbi:MAG: hypothetical protein ACFFD8_10060, partial [Candidatus Thorarchaeota archaeon]
MTTQLLINDSWVLERAGYFSSSFSGFLSSLTGGLDLSSKIRGGLEIASKFASSKNLKDLGIPEFIKPLVSKISSSFGEDLSKQVQTMIESSMNEVDKDLTESFTKKEKSQQDALAAVDKKRQEKKLKIDKRLAQLDAKFADIDDSLGQKIALRLFGENVNSLTKALYDVAKERGITNEGVLYLIQMLPELEALMYFMNVRKFYRDHTAHSLRVAALGDFLLEKKSPLGVIEAVIKDQLDFTKEEVRTAWWFTGLLHDIGTPLEKLSTSVNWS